MIPLIEDNKDAITRLCRQFGVRRLALFGSAAKGAFDPATSDLDFVIDLGDYERGVARRYLGFIVAMEQLLGRSVDVVTIRSIRNPVFRQEVMSTSQKIYEADDRTAAA